VLLNCNSLKISEYWMPNKNS